MGLPPKAPKQMTVSPKTAIALTPRCRVDGNQILARSRPASQPVVSFNP
jgi:hypothetical protein